MADNLKPSSPVGLRNVVFALLQEDTPADGATEGSTTYGDIQKLAGAINFDIQEQNSDPDVQYGDDGEFDALYPDPELTGDFELVDLPPRLAAVLLGAKVDDNGVLIRNSDDKPPYIAMGFMSVKGNGADRYLWLYKGRASIPNETYHTKEGETITRQTSKLRVTFIKRNSDKNWQAKVDSDEEAFQAVKNSFFTSVYQPTFANA